MFSFRHLLVLLAIVLVIFGAKRLRTIGSDLGGAVKGFKKAMNDDDDQHKPEQLKSDSQDANFDSTPTSKSTDDKVNKG